MCIRKITLILFCIFSIQIAAQACSCGGSPTFCGMLNNNSWSYSHVIQATKLKDTLHGMIVMPEKVYIEDNNHIVPQQPITVWGDPGHLCRVYTSNFSVGEKLVLAIGRMDIPEYNHEEAGDFTLSFCGLHYLRITNDVVQGYISGDNQSMALEDFEVYMETEAYETNCTVINATSNIDELNGIKIFPNPAQDVLTIVNETTEEPIERLAIYNSKGQLVNINRTATTGVAVTMDLGDLTSGIYFVQIRMRDRMINKKIMIE